MRGIIKPITKHVSYSINEYLSLGVFAILFGFILSYNKFGLTIFETTEGLIQLLYNIIVFLFTLFLVTFIQKSIGAHIGILPTFKISKSYIFIPLVFSFLSGGALLFFIPPGFVTKEHLRMMIGRNRYRRGFSDYLLIGIFGVMTLIILGLIFSALGDSFVTLSRIFFLYALYSLIPFDFILTFFDKTTAVSNGSAIAYHSRPMFVFTLVFLALTFGLSTSGNFFLSLFLALLLSLIFGVLYFLYDDKVFS